MFKTLRQVTNYKPLHKCDIEELAAEQITRPSGGVLFARNPARQEKDAARKLLLDLFAPANWPSHLKILTMPGLAKPSCVLAIIPHGSQNILKAKFFTTSNISILRQWHNLLFGITPKLK